MQEDGCKEFATGEKYHPALKSLNNPQKNFDK